MVIFHSSVSLPEGNWEGLALPWLDGFDEKNGIKHAPSHHLLRSWYGQMIGECMRMSNGSHRYSTTAGSRLCKIENPQSWSVSTAKKTSNQNKMSMLWKSMYQHHSRIGNGILIDINRWYPIVGVAMFDPWPRFVERTISWAGLTGPADVITVKTCCWYPKKMGNWAPISGSFTGTVKILSIGLTQRMEWAIFFQTKPYHSAWILIDGHGWKIHGVTWNFSESCPCWNDSLQTSPSFGFGNI